MSSSATHKAGAFACQQCTMQSFPAINSGKSTILNMVVTLVLYKQLTILNATEAVSLSLGFFLLFAVMDFAVTYISSRNWTGQGYQMVHSGGCSLYHHNVSEAAEG